MLLLKSIYSGISIGYKLVLIGCSFPKATNTMYWNMTRTRRSCSGLGNKRRHHSFTHSDRDALTIRTYRILSVLPFSALHHNFRVFSSCVGPERPHRCSRTLIEQVRNLCVYSRPGDRVWPWPPNSSVVTPPPALQLVASCPWPGELAKGPSLLLPPSLPYSANVKLTARLSALAVRKICPLTGGQIRMSTNFSGSAKPNHII